MKKMYLVVITVVLLFGAVDAERRAAQIFLHALPACLLQTTCLHRNRSPPTLTSEVFPTATLDVTPLYPEPPIYPGAQNVQTSIPPEDPSAISAKVITFETTDLPEDVQSFYGKVLQNQGWHFKGNGDDGYLYGYNDAHSPNPSQEPDPGPPFVTIETKALSSTDGISRVSLTITVWMGM